MAFGVLEWRWQLPGGEWVRAELDAQANQETVWLGPQMVSRLPAGDRFGHSVTLASGRAAQVAFDTFGENFANCTLTLDGLTVAPRSAPRRGTVFRISMKGMPKWLAIQFGVLVVMTTIFAADRWARSSRYTSNTPEPAAVPDAKDKPVNATTVYWVLDDAFKRCYAKTPGTETSTPGRIVVRATIDDGQCTDTKVLEADGYSVAMTDCIEQAFKKGYFYGSGTVEVPIPFKGKK